MRRDVAKYLFIGAGEDTDRFFMHAQETGLVEFIDASGRGARDFPEEISRILAAKKILRRLEPLPQEDLDDLSAADFIAARILELQEKHDRLAEEKRLLAQEIVRVHVFGHFSLEDVAYIEDRGRRVVQFFFGKEAHPLDPEVAKEVIYVGSAFDLSYYVSIQPEKRTYPGLTEMRIDRPMGVLQARLTEVEEEMRSGEEELKSYAKRRDYLRRALIEKLNRFHFEEAESFAAHPVDSAVFAITGWAPKHRVDEVHKMADSADVYMSEVAILPTDRVPTYLENKGFARIGEDLVHVYDTPSTSDRDPSRWLLWFFTFFFAVIINDAGYGLLMLATVLFFWWRFWKKAKAKRRFLKLALILAIACVIWGTMTTSFFGITIPPGSPLRKLSLSDWLVHKKVEYVLEQRGETLQEWIKEFPDLAEVDTAQGWLENAIKFEEGQKHYFLLDRLSNNVLLEFAILIGCIHICLAFLRVIDRNWAGIGWVLFIIGAYLYFPSFLHATSMVNYVFGVPTTVSATVGFDLIWIGLGLAIVLSLIQNRLKGLAEVMNVVQIFADVLSYLRLYALGLAGAMMAATFNDLAASAGIVFGILIAVFGHVVNIGLTLMSAVIHGLRLNYLEWYRHCFEGGGRSFKPLKLLTFN